MASVLVVEDDPGILRLTERFLREAGFEVSVAQSVEEAVASLQRHGNFDVVLTDFFLNGRTATPLLDLLTERFSSVSVVLMSGGNERIPIETVHAAGKVSGAISFIQKPFLRHDLIHKITDALEI